MYLYLRVSLVCQKLEIQKVALQPSTASTAEIQIHFSRHWTKDFFWRVSLKNSPLKGVPSHFYMYEANSLKRIFELEIT